MNSGADFGGPEKSGEVFDFEILQQSADFGIK